MIQCVASSRAVHRSAAPFEYRAGIPGQAAPSCSYSRKPWQLDSAEAEAMFERSLDRVIALWTNPSGKPPAIKRLQTAPPRQRHFERPNERLHHGRSGIQLCRTFLSKRALTAARECGECLVHRRIGNRSGRVKALCSERRRYINGPGMSARTLPIADCTKVQ